MLDGVVDSIQSSHILIGLSITLIGMLILQCAKLVKRIDALQGRLIQSEESQGKKLKVVNQGAIGVGQRLLKIEKKLNLVLQQQSQLELKDPENLNYQHALSMMETGLDANQVMKTCGLAQGEAELIQSMSSKSSQKKMEQQLNSATS